MRTDDATIVQRAVPVAPPAAKPVYTRGLRRAGFAAVIIVLASSALLYQNNIRAARPPDFTRGGPFASREPVLNAITLEGSPSPQPGLGTLHSSATLTAPSHRDFFRPVAPGAFTFPELGTYVYDVKGSERATAFGTRDYPPEMQMTVHRPETQSSSEPTLKPDELDFDLNFSSNHEEREIVAYRATGIMFTYEAGSITFGPGFTQSSQATYDPPMTQILVPLKAGAKVSGTSEARDPTSGTVTRTEDWTVEVLRQEAIKVLGKATVTWVVKIDRQSRPGTSEQDTRSRTYWFDPARRIWVKWSEIFDGSQDVGPGAFDYHTEFTATLKRIDEPGSAGEPTASPSPSPSPGSGVLNGSPEPSPSPSPSATG